MRLTLEKKTMVRSADKSIVSGQPENLSKQGSKRLENYGYDQLFSLENDEFRGF